MRTWRRSPLALAAAVALLAGGAACTEDPPPEPRSTPRPLPTGYEGTSPPGLGAQPLRVLHGPTGAGPDLLDDPMGVRVQGLGDAFLVSSNREDRHALVRASDGTTVWDGAQQVERFAVAPDGAAALVVSERLGKKGAEDRRTRTTVVDDGGAKVWSGTDPRESYLDGRIVRRPKGWSTEKPYGAFTVSDTEGAEEAAFDFTDPGEKKDGDSAEGGGADAADEPEHFGVPVGVSEDVLFLDDGAGRLQARDLGDDGGLLWQATGDTPEIEDADPLARPRIVGVYDLPADPEEDPPAEGDATEEDAAGKAEKDAAEKSGAARPSSEDDGAADKGGDADSADGDNGDGKGPATDPVVLVRWATAEDPSVLSLHDLRSGDVRWSLPEPGANPAGRVFDPGPAPGTISAADTATVLLPQSSGETPMIALDLSAGEIRWQFDDESERAFSPAFTVGGYLYGDARGADDGDAQVVLDILTKDVVEDELPAYVEAVTADGHALVVQERQRFVFPPPDDATRSAPPASEPG